MLGDQLARVADLGRTSGPQFTTTCGGSNVAVQREAGWRVAAGSQCSGEREKERDHTAREKKSRSGEI
jgi:hypothetical protein